jgi:hypothetical protein
MDRANPRELSRVWNCFHRSEHFNIGAARYFYHDRQHYVSRSRTKSSGWRDFNSSRLRRCSNDRWSNGLYASALYVDRRDLRT